MNKKLIYIIGVSSFLLTSCQQEELHTNSERCILQLDLSRVGVQLSKTRAIDQDLAIRVLDHTGAEYIAYKAGSVPNKLVLSPGKFTVQAFTENQTTWPQENNGKGAPCYYGECEVVMEYDMVTIAHLQVPMTNYAVTLNLPEHFDFFFHTYTFSLKSGFRETSIKAGEKAYFDPAKGGYTYQLTATNTDDHTHQITPISYRTVEAGKCYNMTYYYGTDGNTGGLDIEITDNMENQDVVVPLNR